MITRTEQTLDVMNHHLEAFMTNQGVDAIVSDYDEHAVFHAPDRVYRGVDEIRCFFQTFLDNLPQRALEIFRLQRQEAHDDVGYIVWTIGEMVPLGTDTFVIKDGRIVQQTYAAHVCPL
ncbi:MAG: nuclear transport factor 2 family protein [Betaproteobacteria bacterium]|nr:nuclear transport factor 2 family protein [Betaproteobacteria bacterium]